MTPLLRLGSIILSIAFFAAGSSVAALAGWKSQSNYYASSATSGGKEPINIIVANRTMHTSGAGELDLALELGSSNWYDNWNCYDFTMRFHGADPALSMSTDNGTGGDPIPWNGCGDAERNHFRAYEHIDQPAYDRRSTMYIAASLETIGEHPVYDNNNNYVGICPGGSGQPHCLTRKSFDWGRDGYGTIPGAWEDIEAAWRWVWGWPVATYNFTLSPAPTAWIWQGLAAFKSDGKAEILEHAWDHANTQYVQCASSSFLAGGGGHNYDCDQAIDGSFVGRDFNALYRWRTATGVAPPHWLRLELPTIPFFPNYDGVQVVSGTWVSGGCDLGGCGGGAYTNTLRSFKIQVSNSASGPWTTVDSVANIPNNVGVVEFEFSPRSERHIRLHVTAVNGTNQANVYTVKVHRRP